jgi:uncharacterized protein
VSIGGNFNEETIESYPELLRYLSRQKFAASIGQVSFKPIVERAKSAIALTPVDGSGKPLNGTCMSVAGSGAANARDDCDFLDARMAWLHEETRRHGFSAPDGVHMGPCEIHRSHSHTIGPDGSLYPCPGFTGDRGKSIGHIDEASDPACGRTAAAFEELAAWKECHGCPFIPVCAGGCTVAAYAAFGDITKPNCHKRSFEAGVAALAREAAASAMSAPALAS